MILAIQFEVSPVPYSWLLQMYTTGIIYIFEYFFSLSSSSFKDKSSNPRLIYATILYVRTNEPKIKNHLCTSGKTSGQVLLICYIFCVIRTNWITLSDVMKKVRNFDKFCRQDWEFWTEGFLSVIHRTIYCWLDQSTAEAVFSFRWTGLVHSTAP